MQTEEILENELFDLIGMSFQEQVDNQVKQEIKIYNESPTPKVNNLNKIELFFFKLLFVKNHEKKLKTNQNKANNIEFITFKKNKKDTILDIYNKSDFTFFLQKFL